MRHVYYQASGGVVVRADEVLLLDRPGRGEVRLPKGHVEEGESPAETALREVCEEAGYDCLEIVADLGSQQVEFVDLRRNRRVTRDERYFLMRLYDDHQVARAKKEHQFVALWAPTAAAVARLTFESEQEFVRRALHWIGENGFPNG